MLPLLAFADIATPAPVVVEATPGRGVSVRSKNSDAFSVVLRPRVQVRGTYTDTHGAMSTFEAAVRTVRLMFDGNLLRKELTYRIQFAFGAQDYEKDATSPVYDAYLEYGLHRDASIRVGQFFVPMDRSRTIRENSISFTERPLVIRELGIGRDVGIQVGSNDLGGVGKLSYALYLGSGQGINRLTPGHFGPLVTGRFSVHPFGAFDEDSEGDPYRLPNLRMATGVGGAHNHASPRKSGTFGTSFTSGTTDYSYFAVDNQIKWRGLYLFQEFILRSAADTTVGKDAEPTRSAFGGFFHAGIMVTDHVELLGRYEHMIVMGKTDAAFKALRDESGQQVSTGTCVYLNGHSLKLQFDYTHGWGQGEGSRDVGRMQVDAAF
jgi:phosphate-selective porin OprO/OprP